MSTPHLEIVALQRENEELRGWVARLQKSSQTLTCVYCGKEYPPGSPTHGSSVLTEHIKVCEKHPLRAAEACIAGLRGALVPLMLLKSQHCDGSIGWRGQPEAIAGEIRVKDILAAERALDGTTISEDAKTYVEHKWVENNGRVALNRPQGPCSCEACNRIREHLKALYP